MKTSELSPVLTESRHEEPWSGKTPRPRAQPRNGKRSSPRSDSTPVQEGRWRKYLTEFDVSEITGRSLSALRKDRHFGRGIPYMKMGRQVRYSCDDVDRFMESCRIQTRVLR